MHTYLEAEPRAKTQACSIPLKYSKGFFLTTTKYMMKIVPRVWMSSPRITVSMYNPSCSAVSARFGMLMILPAIRHMIPNGEYLAKTELRLELVCIILSKSYS